RRADDRPGDAEGRGGSFRGGVQPASNTEDEAGDGQETAEDDGGHSGREREGDRDARRATAKESDVEHEGDDRRQHDRATDGKGRQPPLNRGRPRRNEIQGGAQV